jgi:hypothetical protein
MMGQQLHSVADTKYRNIKREPLGVKYWGIVVRDASGSTRKDKPLDLREVDRRWIRSAGLNLAVNVKLTHAAGYKLGVLGAEIEDENHRYSVRL